MSPAAEKFVADVRRIDSELADMVASELNRGVSLLAMIDLLQTGVAASRAIRRAQPSTGANPPKGD